MVDSLGVITQLNPLGVISRHFRAFSYILRSLYRVEIFFVKNRFRYA